MTNALGQEASLYLRQHADNPVDWLPWGPAALGRARAEGKPILLSIGYSACHWCHVMAHESFEDPDTASLMNALFVNIKVDREERPDLDRIYQHCQQLFTGRAGGWPLTVFLTPDEQWPFFAGTYFPNEARYGMPSFRDVLTRVEAYFRQHRDEIDGNAGRLLELLTDSTRVDADPALAIDSRYRETARRRLGNAFDAANGGFGGAPKFPHPTEIDFLLGLGPDDREARRIALESLKAMLSGGLFDHLGGGFFRYSVDAEWRIPHFEKMLYDNVALLGVSAEAFATTGDALFAGSANATADWLLERMRHPDGAFHSTLDADSEGEEGRYYVFESDEFDAALHDSERQAARAYFGLDEPPNFEDRAWHLQPRERVVPFGAGDAALESARARLLALRERRPPPGRDDKILTAWNGLAISQFARAARRLGRDSLGEAAAGALDFVRRALWRDGRLMATWNDGVARFPAYLDDYALLAAGLVELMQWRFRAADLEFAIALAEAMLEHFADPAGGFFFTADDHESLIHRPKPLADEALPSGNGAAALALDTLGHLLGEPRYLDAAAATIRAALPTVARFPEAHATLLAGIERQIEPPEILVVRAAPPALDEWRSRIDTRDGSKRLAFFIADDAGELPGLLAERSPGDAPRAYLCRGTQCEAPIASLETLVARLAPDSGFG